MKNLEDLQKEISKDLDKPDIQELKKKYLAQDGLIRKAFSEISKVSKEDKAEYGRELNNLKNEIEKKISSYDSSPVTETKRIDPTAPFGTNTDPDKRPRVLDLDGSSHLLMKELRILTDIFLSMGFDIVESRQIDDDYHMFESLNFPKGHPARDMYDTFWTEDCLILPAHTSTMQNRILSSTEPPIRTVIPGRCFRNESKIGRASCRERV